MKKFFQEFKAFISRGNILDMACGVIVGGAFNTIVTTLNKNVLMPVINLGINSMTNGTGLYTILPDSKLATNEAIEAGVATVLGPDGLTYTRLNFIDWSSFFESIINFFFIALTLFIILKVVKKLSEHRAKIEKMIKDKLDDKLEEIKGKDDDEVEEVKEEVEVVETPKVKTELEVLEEIKDLLQQQK